MKPQTPAYSIKAHNISKVIDVYNDLFLLDKYVVVSTISNIRIDKRQSFRPLLDIGIQSSSIVDTKYPVYTMDTSIKALSLSKENLLTVNFSELKKINLKHIFYITYDVPDIGKKIPSCLVMEKTKNTADNTELAIFCINIWAFLNYIRTELHLSYYKEDGILIKANNQPKIDQLFNESIFIFSEIDYGMIYHGFKNICNIHLSSGNKNVSYVLTESQYQLTLKLNSLFKLTHTSLTEDINKKIPATVYKSIASYEKKFISECKLMKDTKKEVFNYDDGFIGYFNWLEAGKQSARSANIERRKKNDPNYEKKLDHYRKTRHFPMHISKYFLKFKPSYSTLATSNSMTICNSPNVVKVPFT